MKTFTLLIAILFTAGLQNSLAQNNWTQKADCGGIGRWAAVGFSIGSKGYIGTGVNGTSTFLSDFWEYDPATDAWTQKADYAGGLRYGATGFSIGSKGYLGTGGDAHGNYYKDFWEYDPASNAWTRKADFWGTARYFAVGFSIDVKGYIGTGDLAGNGTDVKDFWEYDPATDVWTRKADFGGVARRSAVGFSIGSKGYLGTGEGYYKDFWEYDPATNAWTRKADFAGGERYTSVGFSIGTKGYIGVGFFDLKDFWEYDPASNGWARKANFGGTGRGYAVGFSIGDKGYIGTGVYPVGYKDFWEYTPGNSCSAPTGLKVLHVSDTCAVLSCNTTDDVSTLQIRYRPQGDVVWMRQRKNPDHNRIFINELMPNTTYQWQVRSFCTEDTSGWVKGPDFTTDASLQPITTSVVYPNPAKNAVTINYTVSKNGQYIFEITDLIGRILSRKEINAPQGVNRTTLNVSQLTKGAYFINIIKPDNTREKIQLSKE